MADYICKMCGAQISGIDDNLTYGKCPYCSSLQTFPHGREERTGQLFERAEHFRRNGEYDKATEILEGILKDDPENAECHWRLLLNSFGIDYVDDGSGSRIPTINRMNSKPLYETDNYKSVMKYADPSVKEIYENEAALIDNLQKRIFEIAAKEKPFDVFISYKSKDTAGRRTQESVIANDIYHQLVNEGFNVFFAEISLESCGGTEYEPYIYSALTSASAMIVIGTSAENMQSVWVRNEWSRYLSLCEDAEERILIPCYKDMDPYDLPKEFSTLGILDMSRIDFSTELLRTLKKVCKRQNRENNIHSGYMMISDRLLESGDTRAIYKRAIMNLEEGFYADALSLLKQAQRREESITDIAFYKTLAENKCSAMVDFRNLINENVNTAKIGKPSFNYYTRNRIEEVITSKETPEYYYSLTNRRRAFLLFMNFAPDRSETYDGRFKKSFWADLQKEKEESPDGKAAELLKAYDDGLNVIKDFESKELEEYSERIEETIKKVNALSKKALEMKESDEQKIIKKEARSIWPKRKINAGNMYEMIGETKLAEKCFKEASFTEVAIYVSLFSIAIGFIILGGTLGFQSTIINVISIVVSALAEVGIAIFFIRNIENYETNNTNQ